MKARITIALLLGAGCALPGPAVAPRPSRELAGRVAGAPQRCVASVRTEALRIDVDDPRQLLYGRGRTLWVNRPGGPCQFHPGDVLVVETVGGNYCRGDLVKSYAPQTRIPGESCRLAEFVPYTR